jgi:hypothetical protein
LTDCSFYTLLVQDFKARCNGTKKRKGPQWDRTAAGRFQNCMVFEPHRGRNRGSAMSPPFLCMWFFSSKADSTFAVLVTNLDREQAVDLPLFLNTRPIRHLDPSLFLLEYCSTSATCALQREQTRSKRSSAQHKARAKARSCDPYRPTGAGSVRPLPGP